MKKKNAVTEAARLDRMIAEATVDCHDYDEAVSGWCATLDDKLTVPFATVVLGVEVIVQRIDFNDAGDIVAICRRGKANQAVAIVDLPLPDPAPDGAEWIHAYRRWARQGC